MTSAIKEAIYNKIDPVTKSELKTTHKAKYSDNEKHMCAVWQGSKKITCLEEPRPMLTEPTDAIVRITTSTICGSDLHMFANEIPAMGAMRSGDVLGHEAVGIVESVGRDVTKVKPGDRVVISAVIACGTCRYCKQQLFSSCDTTNPSGQMEELYGHRLAGIFGYSHLTGGFDGLQAEYARTPFADNTLLPIPSDCMLSDAQLICLSDIACTGWHGNELGEVTRGDTVAIWGAGPVGLMAAMWAKFRGAARVLVLDKDEFRLSLANSKLGVEVMNIEKVSDVAKAVHAMQPGGWDVCIDCAGYRFSTSKLHTLERALKLESDSLDIIDQMSYATRKQGRMVLIGDYFGYGNHFPIGRVMEKAIRMQGGQVLVQKYWKELLGYFMDGKVDPSFVFTHTLPLEHVGEGYKMFFEHEDNCVKILLQTKFGTEQPLLKSDK